MEKIKLGFAIFWRMLALDYLLQLTVFAVLILLIQTPLAKVFGSFFIKIKPSIFYLLFATVLFLLCNTKFLTINRYVWKRVFTVPLDWVSCYRAYAYVAILLAIINYFVAIFADDVAWVNYKLTSGFVFLVIPVVLANRLNSAKA